MTLGPGTPGSPSAARIEDARRAKVIIAMLGIAAMVASLFAAGPGAASAAAQESDDDCPWMDASLSADDRARLLLDASTLEQKMRWLVEHPATQPQRTEFAGGVTYPPQVPCTPEITFANGAHGVHAGSSLTTAFPVPIAEAAAWDPDISLAKGTIVAQEAFRAGRNVILGPGMAGGRTPLSGRTSEYYGEDPVLTGVLGAASVLGIEEGNPDMPVVANLKHYVANEQELDRDSSSSNVDERTRRQIYDLSYEIAIRESDPGSVMCSYNQINGVWACENPILDDVLKEEFGFEGFVMSDFGSVHSTAPSLQAGLDMELNRPVWFTPERLHDALDAGEITEQQIDDAAFRVVRAFIEVGLFDHPLPDEPETDVITPESLDLARRMAEEGSVLLKNESVLPLEDDADQAIAVIGPTASNEPTDGISAASVCSAHLRFTSTRTSVPCPDPVSPLEGIEARAPGRVVFDDGQDLEAAAAAAADADVAVVFGYYRMGEFSDIEDLSLEGNGDDLIAAVAAANPNTVVVLQAGSAVTMPWLDDVDAVLHTWYPGREMGTAIARLLFGDVNPSGKLPMTFPTSLADTPTHTEARYPGIVDESGIRQVEYSEGMQVGYRWYQAQGIEPLFPFGHGLSYTTFDYSHVQVTPKSADGRKELRVRFRVTNTGDRRGEEIAQVYLELPAQAGEPFKRLVGWAKVDLAPGQHRNVQVTLTAEDLANRHLLQYWDETTESWTTPSGTYHVHVGRSSEDLPLNTTFRVR